MLSQALVAKTKNDLTKMVLTLGMFGGSLFHSLRHIIARFSFRFSN